MKGDFSTERFNPSKHYNRVLKQQGRVDLDSDWNEQAAISQHLLRTLTVDLIGRRGGPVNDLGFSLTDAATVDLTPAVGDFVIGAGRYYVDGLLAENERAVYYSAQPDLPAVEKLAAGKKYVAYLDVWERHITHLEDEWIREVALGGPDTATRVKTLWQVKVLEAGAAAPAERPIEADKLNQQLAAAQAKLEAASKALEAATDRVKINALKKSIANQEKQIAAIKPKLEALPAAAPIPRDARPEGTPAGCGDLLKPLVDWKSGTMKARLEPSEPSDTPCVLPPESRYRGLENHLYRIEVHASGDTSDPNKVPTFKWSRENGSVATRALGAAGATVRVANSRDFAAQQWIEFTSESDDLLGRGGPLAMVTKVDGDVLTVTAAPPFHKDLKLPKVRRWDQTGNDERVLLDGAIPITPGTGDKGWIEIEDGIEVQFSAGQYRGGDYWLITARVATGKIDWPLDSSDKEMALGPRGIVHHYAPLYMLEATGAEPFVTLTKDCRCRFAPLPCLEEIK